LHEIVNKLFVTGIGPHQEVPKKFNELTKQILGFWKSVKTGIQSITKWENHIQVKMTLGSAHQAVFGFDILSKG